MTSIAESIPLSAWGTPSRTSADMQRSLAAGRCAACDLPVKTGYKRRRTCLCPLCGLTLSWCSRCQQPKPHDAFAKDASQANGLNRECRACRVERKRERRPQPACARKGCGNLVAVAENGLFRKLCPGCLASHCWCSDCKRARWRKYFARDVRRGRRHASICLACNQARRPATGARAAITAEARATYTAIRDHAAAHPEHGKAEICQALGVSPEQIKAAMGVFGFQLGHGPLKARALARYRAVVDMTLPAIMKREGMSYKAAIVLRSRARKALKETL
jgi:hypothetical protein